MTPQAKQIAAQRSDTAPLLQVHDLSVSFNVDGHEEDAVRRAGFAIDRGEILAIVGESGSGKSVTSMSILGLLPKNARVAGSIRFAGEEILGATNERLRNIRGTKIAMIFQDPLAALNPVLTIGFQIAEAVRAHRPGLSSAQVRSRTMELLQLVEIPDPESRLSQYPHQFSGGQCQRIVIAAALASDPELLIADEPTTALDVTVQAEVLEVIRRIHEQRQSSVLLITHDMGVVADMADRVVVMRQGEVIETSSVQRLFDAPEHPYTQKLLASVPRIGARAALTTPRSPGAEAPGAALDIRDLVVEYRRPLRTPFRAVDGVDLRVNRGEIVALVGESGSGKTTVGMATVGIAPITSGEVAVVGRSLQHASRQENRAIRKRIGVVFQNPSTSLNPRFSVRASIAEPLAVHLRLRGTELRDRVDELLESVQLDGSWGQRYPHELSGGQRQRVAIARAVALDPELLIADEPTSALDVSVQARVLEIFRSLQERLGFGCLFISHDLAVVDSLCDRVVVMHRGTVVEQGTREEIFMHPTQKYTRKLLAAAPVPDPVLQRARRLERLAG